MSLLCQHPIPLSHSLPPSLPPSIPPSLPPSRPPVHPPFLPSSFPPSLPPSLPSSHPPSPPPFPSPSLPHLESGPQVESPHEQCLHDPLHFVEPGSEGLRAVRQAVDEASLVGRSAVGGMMGGGGGRKGGHVVHGKRTRGRRVAQNKRKEWARSDSFVGGSEAGGMTGKGIEEGRA